MANGSGLVSPYKFPCKDCPDRHHCCWSACLKYKEAVAENEKKKEWLKGPYAGMDPTAAWIRKDRRMAKHHKSRNRFRNG